MKFLKRSPILIAFLAGMVGAVLRGHELVYCYNYSTALYTWDNWSKALVVLGAVMTAVFVIVSLTRKRSEMKYMELYGVGAGGASALVFTGLALAVVGVLSAVSYLRNRSLLNLLYGVMTILGGLFFVVQGAQRKSKPEDPQGYSFAVPIYWASAFVVYTFMEHPVEPIPQLYACDLLAVCFLLVSIHGCAAKMFGRKSEKVTLFATLMSIMLVVASVGSAFTAMYFSGSIAFLLDSGERGITCLVMLPMLVTNAALLLTRLDFLSKEKGEDEI